MSSHAFLENFSKTPKRGRPRRYTETAAPATRTERNHIMAELAIETLSEYGDQFSALTSGQRNKTLLAELGRINKDIRGTVAAEIIKKKMSQPTAIAWLRAIRKGKQSMDSRHPGADGVARLVRSAIRRLREFHPEVTAEEWGDALDSISAEIFRHKSTMR
jgi:hypothetical protein